MEFHCIINCLRRPRNFAIAVECSATQGHAKQRSYVFVYSSFPIRVNDVAPEE